MERRLAAILAADVVGYSRLIEADEAGHASSRLDMMDASSVDAACPLLKIRANYFATTKDPASEHGRVSRISRGKPR